MPREEEIEALAFQFHEIWRENKREDLAAISYEDLPEYWQGENRAAALAAIDAVESSRTIEEAAEKIHIAWALRNESKGTSYKDLTETEKDKDRQQVIAFLDLSSRFTLGPGGTIISLKESP